MDRGKLWVGSNQGLWAKGANDMVLQQYLHSPADRSSLSSSNIQCLLQDRSGILWIGTYGGGVNKFLPSKQRFGHFKSVEGVKSSLSHNYVTAMEVLDNGQLWVGTVQGVDVFNLTQEKVKHYNSDQLTYPQVTCLAKGKSGVWVGTQSGLNLIKPKIGVVKQWQKEQGGLSNDHIYSLYEDEEGVLWVGTGNGLNKLNADTGEIQQFLSEADNPIGLGGSIITDIIPSRNGWLWVATYDGGFYKFNTSTEIFKGYWRGISGNPDSESHSVLCLYEADEQNLWIGTFESGLYKFLISDEQLIRFSVDEGMPNNQVCGILEDKKGQVWCSTADRLVCFDPESEDYRSYDIKDGLQGNEFSNKACAKNYEGILYFGGPNGFNAFDPSEIQDNKYTPKVVITGFELFNKPVEVSEKGPLTMAVTELEEIVLKYDQHSFAFEFAGLSYQLPERNQYAYKMEGIDESWQYIGNRRKAYFTDVDPGEYLFKVKATNSDGVWNQEATIVRVKVNAPFWNCLLYTSDAADDMQW